MKALVEYFPECLENAASSSPVVLVLDSLDQLSPDEGARQMGWLPKDLCATLPVCQSCINIEQPFLWTASVTFLQAFTCSVVHIPGTDTYPTASGLMETASEINKPPLEARCV